MAIHNSSRTPIIPNIKCHSNIRPLRLAHQELLLDPRLLDMPSHLAPVPMAHKTHDIPDILVPSHKIT